MEGSLCRLCESNIFGMRAVFGMDACHIFPQSTLAIVSLIAGMFGVVMTKAYTGCWAGPPLCSVVVTALLKVKCVPWLLESNPQIQLYAAA